MGSFVLCFLSILCYLGAQGQVISEPDDITVCEGTASTTLSCILNSSISSDDVQWYRLIKGTNTAQRVSRAGNDFVDVPVAEDDQNTLTTTLYIFNARRSYTGYYWVILPSGDVCNTSFTVSNGPPALTVNIIKNTESSSIVVQWDEVDDSFTTNYTVTWTNNGINSSHTLTEQSSYTITGLTLDTVYTITVTASNKCGQGPEYRTNVSFSAGTTSNTSSNDSVTFRSTVNPTTTIVASVSMVTTTAVTMSSTSTVTTDSTTSSITNLDVTTDTTTLSTVNATTFVIESSSIITATTTTLVMISSISTLSTTTTTTAIATTTTTTTPAANNTTTNNTATNIVVTTTATPTDIVMSPTSSAKPTDTTVTDESSGDDNIAYLIVGATLGGIIILSLLIVMFCCFGRSKSDIFNRIKFSPLKDKSTTDKNIPMVANPLSANDDDDKKPAKLEAETSHQTSATMERPVMPDTESIVDSNINSQPLEPSDTYDKLGPPQPLEPSDPYFKLRPPQPLDQCDNDDKLPSLIKDDDTCDKGDGGLHNDGPPCSDANQKNDVPVDDPQKGTYDVPRSNVPVVTVPCVDGPTTDGANQNKTDRRLNYAVLDTLPAPTGNYIRKDNSDVTAYAIVT